MHSVAIATPHRFIQVGGQDECWPWTGYRNPDGYGRLTRAGRQILAHRFAYEQLVGPIPDALPLDHLCRNRACCNPVHLEPVTPAENNRRGIRVGVDRCKNGHAYTPANTIWCSPTRRNCRTCQRIASRRSRMKKRGGGVA